jgi:site-specific recombinase XerD
MRLTKATVDRIRLPHGKSEIIVFDEILPGFGLRIRAGGKRTWIAQYRFGSQQRRVTIGTVETVDADEARNRARIILAKVHLGTDPQVEKAEARAQTATTLGDVIDSYLARHAAKRLKPGTFTDVERYLRRHWAPLSRLPVRNVTRADVAVQLARIAEQSGGYAANRARATLSALYAWAIAEGLTDANPVVGTRKPADETARDRVLTDDELAAIWRQAGEGDYGAIVRLLLLTGQRREEVAAMTWDELDLEGATWSMGGNRTKNSRAHDFPLASGAVEILKTLERREGRALVFGSQAGPFSGWSKAKASLDNRVAGVLTHVDNAQMGLVFEELIRKFAEVSNETAGEHFTPREVIRLMVNLIFAEDNEVLTKPGVVRTIYDPAAGTGGMLSVAEEHLTAMNPKARLTMYGQELNPESYAICKADMLIKGQDVANIVFGNTLSDDGHAGQKFDYMLSNPPFGVEWKKVEKEVRKEQQTQGFNGRFGPGLPRISDGSMLFLMHLLSKMRPAADGGSRFGLVLNGSPLFTGGAGSGESEIRRYVLENDLLEAIIGLPTDMFYNTGISTYRVEPQAGATQGQGAAHRRVQLLAEDAQEPRLEAQGNERGADHRRDAAVRLLCRGRACDRARRRGQGGWPRDRGRRRSVAGHARGRQGQARTALAHLSQRGLRLSHDHR